MNAWKTEQPVTLGWYVADAPGYARRWDGKQWSTAVDLRDFGRINPVGHAEADQQVPWLCAVDVLADGWLRFCDSSGVRPVPDDWMVDVELDRGVGTCAAQGWRPQVFGERKVKLHDPAADPCGGSERWLPVVGFEGYYEVSNQGSVRSVDRQVSGVRSGKRTTIFYKGKPMQTRESHDGYVRIRLARDNDGMTRLLHRIVAEAFIQNPKGLPQVAHLNGARADCRAANLMWVEQSENESHKVEHGTHRRGEKHPLARLTPEMVQLIRSLSISNALMGQLFGVSRAHVAQIKSNRRWSHQ